MVNFNGSSLVEQANTLLTESSVNWKLREDPELDNIIEENESEMVLDLSLTFVLCKIFYVCKMTIC